MSSSPDQGGNDCAPNQPLRAKIDQIIDKTISHGRDGEDLKHVFVHDVWPTLEAEYIRMTKGLTEFCISGLEQRTIHCQVDGRTKTEDSIRKSLSHREEQLLKQYQKRYESLQDIFNEMHDLVGIRIVLDLRCDIEKANSFIQETFRQEKVPNVFSSDRNVGQSWKPWFGAYQSRNHHVSLESGKSEPLSQFCGVMFEIQITTLAEDLYNKLAHPLLYKASSGPLSRKDEMVIDMSHAMSLCYELCLTYMKDKLEESSRKIKGKYVDGPEEDIDVLTTSAEVPGSGVVNEVVADGNRLLEGLRSEGFGNLFCIQDLTEALETPLEECRSIDDLKEWLSRNLKTGLQPLVRRPSNKSVVRSTEIGHSWQLSGENIECLRSLSFLEQEYRYHSIHSAKDTCKWLLEDSQYQAWMDKLRGLFWIKGNPGAGKSVLMKFAVTMMDHRKSRELVLSFFIHGQGKPLQRTPLGVFRALLNSMLESFPKYLSQLTKRFEDQEKRFGSYQMNRWDWNENELQDFMSKVLTEGTKNQPVIIFIDALDECGENFAKSLLTYFKNLMKDVEREKGQVKICFSSRHYPILGLDTISTISVEDRNEKDIRLVIQERLNEIQPEPKRRQIEEQILLKARGGFQWAVLVTTMVIDDNATGTKMEKILEKPTTIPEALDELYTAILSGATDAQKYQMVKLFQWVLFAERPLSAQELREALATDKDMACTTLCELRRHESWADTLGQFETHIKHISRGLVEFQTREIWEQYEPDVEGWDREAQFIHQSVADYMLNKFLKPVTYNYASQSQIGTGHFEISRSCVRYLTLKEVLEGVQLSRSTLSVKFPLVPYAVRFMFHHIKVVEWEGIAQHDLLSLIQWDPQSESIGKIARLWRIFDPNSAHTPMGWPFMGATPLHVLVSFGSKSAFDTLLQRDDIEVDGRDSDGNTPLILAIRERHQDMALTLLNRFIEWRLQHQKTADQNITQVKDKRQEIDRFIDLNAENNDGETPLSIAVSEKADEVILELINAGADLKFVPDETALLFCAICSRNKMLLMKLIEENIKLDGAVYFITKQASSSDDILEGFLSELLKARANTCKSPEFDKYSGNENEDEDEEEHESDDEAIILASRRGQTNIVNLLLFHGASVTSQNKDGKFPLVVAVENGQKEVIEVLLRNVLSESTEEDFGGHEALVTALRLNNEATIKLLLESGKVDTHAKDSNGSMMLSWAAENGHEVVVKLLLEKGANLESKDTKYGQTPLSWAAKNGYAVVVKLLFEKGANLESIDNNGKTPLSWAIENRHEVVVKLLLEKGADLESKDNNGKAPLSRAVEKGNEVVVKLLLEKGASLESKDNNSKTPLSWAIENRHDVMIKLLLEKGADLESKDNNGRTPLLWAASNGHEAVVKLLLEKGSDLESKDNNGRTPLSWAAIYGYEVVVKLLLEKGADLESNDNHGKTPLLWAASNGHEAVVKLLLEKGADLESNDNHGKTPLLWAASNGHEAVVKLLLEKGADLESNDNHGKTPLLWAASNGHEAVVKLLLEKCANLQSKDTKYGQTPLSLAVENRHEVVVKLLLEKGADLESKDNNGKTPLLWAASNGHEAVVKLLLEKGADLESNDNNGKTPLFLAAIYGYEVVVKLLIEKGADLESKDNNARTPLSQAAMYGYDVVVKLLLEKGANLESEDTEYGQTPLSLAAEYGHEAVVKLLLEKGANIESKDAKNGRTPLSWAIEYGHDTVVKLLLEKGANIESKDTKYGQIPLLWAAENGHAAVVKLLLDKGTNIESKDTKYSRTPLSWAAEKGHWEVVNLLLEKGANLESKDTEYGWTPLSWATKYSHQAVVELLLVKGANPEPKSAKNGRTPLSWAIEYGHDTIVKLLLENGVDPESRDTLYNQTPLSWAAEYGHKAIVKLLLENGADPESRDTVYNQTALSWAIEYGHVAVVKLLLENGAKPESRDTLYDQTPLSGAAKYRHEAVVKLLLQNGAVKSQQFDLIKMP